MSLEILLKLIICKVIQFENFSKHQTLGKNKYESQRNRRPESDTEITSLAKLKLSKVFIFHKKVANGNCHYSIA